MNNYCLLRNLSMNAITTLRSVIYSLSVPDEEQFSGHDSYSDSLYMS